MDFSEFWLLIVIAVFCACFGLFISMWLVTGKRSNHPAAIAFLFAALLFILFKIGLDFSHFSIGSITLFAAGIFLYMKTDQPMWVNILCSGLAFISILLFLGYAIANYFTGKGIDSSVFYHLRFGITGTGLYEFRYLISAGMVFTVLVAVFLVRMIMGKKKKVLKADKTIGPVLLLILSCIFNPASVDVYRFVSRETDSNEFYVYYRTPDLRPIGKDRNLIFVYAEGLERTLFNEQIFPGIVQDLRKVEERSISFTNIRQVAGTEWTMAGMIASQCGLPYFYTSQLAIGLGDLLKREGYHLAYYTGDAISFAGKKEFYSIHGFDEICGKKELEKHMEDKDYQYCWGLYDDTLFDLAFKRLEALSKKKNRFAFFVSTMDTHGSGNCSRSCKDRKYGDGSSENLNAVACADMLISRFVNRIRSSSFSQDTVIVIASDHLAPRFLNPSVEKLKNFSRRNLFMINEPGTEKGIRQEQLGSTLDIGSTLLPFIGFRGTIGLGRDLLSTDYSTKEIEEIHSKVHRLRPSMEFGRFL